MTSTTCCIAGGGPAGALLALLLARGGVDVVLLEQHRSFDCEFPGQLLQPGSVDLLEEQGLLREEGKIPPTAPAQVAFFAEGDEPLFGGAIPLASVYAGHRHPYTMLLPQALFLPWCTQTATATGRCRVVMGAKV